MNKEKIISVFI